MMATKTIGFSNDILLIIFRHYIDASPPFWFKLAHVCQTWRQIIFASPRSLCLRLHCTYGTPVVKNLDLWPPLPLVVNYGGFPTLPPPSPEDEDNIMAALEHSDRVCSISLTVSRSLLKKLSTISKPFSELEVLVLLSQGKVQLTLPSVFWWGYRLRTLHSSRIPFPSLPQLLFPSQDLVDLQLQEIPSEGYFSPEAFADSLCGMTQLETLSLHFLSFPPRRNYLSLPPQPENRILLPALTYFKYRGISKYLDTLVARINAPHLGYLEITFFSQPTLDTSQLGRFINRIETWTSPLQADIVPSERAILVTITESGEEALTRLRLQISCEQLDWQLSSISQICDHFSSFLLSVEDLRIKTAGPPSLSGDMDDEQWLRLIRAFDGVKDFYSAADEIGTDVMRALHSPDEGNKTVLPALRNLCVSSIPKLGPLRDLVELFVAQRRRSSQYVNLFYVSWSTAEETASAKRWVKEQKRTIIDRSLFIFLTQINFFLSISFPSGFDGVTSCPVQDSREYTRNLERLDRVLGHIEKYIHIAFAALKIKDLVRGMLATVS